MPRLLTLTASAAAASDRLAETLADGAASAADGFQGFYEYAARVARPALPLSRSSLAFFAQAAAARARIPLAPSDCAAFAGVLSELHGSGATPAEVEAAGRGTAVEGLARELGRALAAHGELLSACGRIDPGALAGAAGRCVAEGRAALEFDAVQVEPRAAWTEGELALVAELATAGLHVGVALPYDSRRPELFAPLEKAHQGLHRVERVECANVDPADGASPPLRARLRELFDLGSQPVRGEGSPVAAFTLPTAEAEAREVALRVRALVRGGCAPDRIAVAGSDETLLSVARTLRAAGLPTARAPARSLAATLPGRAALGLLDLAEGGIEREPLCRVLTAGLWPLGGPPGQRKRGTGLAELLREAGSLDHASGTLLPPLRRHLDRQAPGPHLNDKLELARELDRALAVVEGLPTQGRAAQHAAALWAALRQLGTTQTLLSSPHEPLVGAGAGEQRSLAFVAAAETALALERVGQLLSELAELREEGERRRGSWPTLSRGEFAGLLAAAMAGELAPASREVATGVVLCDPAALVGRTFDHVFLPGLVDAEAEREGDVLLPAALREAICRRLDRPAALPASGRGAQRRQERLRLYLACCSARLTLSGSAPRMDVGGSPLEPAAFLRELARIAGHEEPQRVERPLLPVGELCLTRAEAVAAHWKEPALRAAEPERTAQIGQLADRERRRREAIVAGRADPVSGALAVGESAASLAAELVARLEKKPFSPSLLELMAGCGFRALCDRILDLGPPEERGEELAANEGGTVRHRCLHAGFEALRREGLLPLRGGERRRRELQTLLGGARAEMEAYEREAPIGHPTMWAAEKRIVERQLTRVYGRELSDGDWEPAYFELEFRRASIGSGGPSAAQPSASAAPGGLPPLRPVGGTPPDPAASQMLAHPLRPSPTPQLSLFARPAPPGDESRREPLLLSLPGGPALLGGKIDRVDRRPGGLRVIDYKTGGIASKQRNLADGFGQTQLQLAIYALLVREALGKGSTVDAAYISISEAAISKTIAALCEQDAIDLDLFLTTDEASRARCREEGLPNLVERIAQLVARARAGDFPVTPGNCRYCDHVSACRVGPYYEELD